MSTPFFAFLSQKTSRGPDPVKYRLRGVLPPSIPLAETLTVAKCHAKKLFYVKKNGPHQS